MSLLGNIIWLVFGGFFMALGYIFAGLGLCLTIVGIPFGLLSMKLGLASLAPFGKEVHTARSSTGTLGVIFNVIWLVLFGWELALGHLFWALVLAITIVGLPFAKQHLKLVPLALFPFGQRLE